MSFRPTPFFLLAALSLATAACSDDASETAPAAIDPSADPGCGDTDLPPPADDPGATGDPMTSPATGGLCGALIDLASSDEPAHECVAVMADDCTRIVGTLNDPYVEAVEQCIDDGGDIFECMTDAVDAIAKTAAHEDLAATFCDECAFDAPGCEEVFYIDDSEWGLGTLLLPFSDEVVDTVAAECADGFTCSIDFPNCAMDVIRDRLNVDASRECLMDII